MRLFRWLAAAVVLTVLVLLTEGWTAFGKRASGARQVRIERSRQWKDGHFNNTEPMYNDALAMLTGYWHRSEHLAPDVPLDVPRIDPSRFAAPPASSLRITWLGHSTTLIELEGRRFLTDPVWSDRISPISWLGPKRWYPPPLPLEALPPIDAVLISHDHYDHLDYPTVVALKDKTFVVPLGVGAHLEYWGVAPEHIIELDWWEEARISGITIAATPARHASGRMLTDFGAKLWASYALIGEQRRAYFSGDTGLFSAMKDIGDRYGPFDVTLIEVGQYNRAWPDWHIGPEQAVRAHALLKGHTFLPIHWALFTLAYHGWTEPGERALAAAGQTTLALPRPAESLDPISPPPPQRWWPADVPWQNADVAPIVSTLVDAALTR